MSGLKIAQVGSFDVENYGDILFPYVFEENMKKRIDIDEIILFAPMHTIMPFSENREVYSVSEMEDVYKDKQFDGIVIGGGDLIHFQKIIVDNGKNEKVLYDALNMWLIPCLVAKKYNIPVFFNAPGVPNKLLKGEQEIIDSLIYQSKYISVRDELSKENLCGETDTRVKVVPDTVLSLSKLISKEELDKIYQELNLGIDKDYLVFHANKTIKDEDLKICGETLIKIKQKYNMDIVLMPIGYTLFDNEGLDRLDNMFSGEFIYLKEKLSQPKMMSVIANSKFYIGASLHGLITAMSFGVRNIVYSYNGFNKVEGFLKLAGRTNSLITDSNELFGRFEEISSMGIADISHLQGIIEKHFDDMAELMKKQCKNDYQISASKIADYIYDNSINEHELERLNNEFKLKDKHIENLDSIITALNDTLTKNDEYSKNKYNEYDGIIRDKDNHISNIEKALEETNNHVNNLNEIIKQLREENENMINSFWWKSTKPFRSITSKIKKH